jgi:hypothetical protein
MKMEITITEDELFFMRIERDLSLVKLKRGDFIAVNRETAETLLSKDSGFLISRKIGKNLDYRVVIEKNIQNAAV